jgi:two-component system response regulator AtoC
VAPGKGYAGIVGISAPMQRVFRQLDRLAQSDVSVLIHGESGTGKELIARALHLSGLRSNGPFVAVNSAAIPDSLMESELFGHERGAFTGALNRRTGRFEEAHRGTLFFDEIGELSPAAQAKVLRVLQERKFERLGGTATVASDFRLITATHRNLAREVEENRFREDLYFRLAVYDLEIPPLRSRKEDIPELAAAFIQQHGRGEVEGISSAALNVMLNYAWPGNVRELQNAIMRALVVADGPLLQPEDLPERVRQARVAEPAPVPVVLGMEPEDAATDNALADDTLAGASRKLVLSALTRNGGNASAAMRELNIGRSRFYRMLKAFRLEDTVSQIRQTALPGER